MALALDATTPTVVTATDGGSGSHTVTLTTASFTPPAGSVLIVMFLTNEGNGGTLSAFAVTDNLASHLTYTSITATGNNTNDVQTHTWWATIATSHAMTVSCSYLDSANNSGSPSALRVLVITGAKTSAPIGAHSSGRGRTTNVTGATAQYTSTAAGSWGWLTYADWTASGVPTVPAGEAIDASFSVAGQDSFAVIKNTATTATSGTTVTMSTSTPTSGLQLTWSYFELVPSAAGLAFLFTETGIPSDSIARLTGKSAADSLSISDLFVRASTLLRSWVDAITGADSTAKQTGVPFTETGIPSDSIARLTGKSASDSLSISDLFVRASTLLRSWVDAIIASDLISRLTSRPLVAAITPSDAIAKQTGLPLAEAGSPVDSISRLTGKGTSDAFSVSDTLSRIATLLRSLSDSITSSDTVLASKVLLRAIFDSFSAISDSISRKTSKAVSDSIIGADVLLRAASLLRTWADSISQADSLSKSTLRAIADSIGIVDSILKKATRSVSDAFSATESLVRSAVHNAADAFALADAVGKNTSRTVADSLSTVADSIIRTVGLAATDAFTLAEGAAKSIGRSISDAVSWSDSIVRSTVHSLVDSISASDSIATLKAILRSFSESISIADVLAFAGNTFTQTLSDAISLADSGFRAATKAVSDLISMVDAMDYGREFARILSDALVVSESLVRLCFRWISDAISQTDSLSASVFHVLSTLLSDSLGVVDSAVRQAGKSFADAVTQSDTWSVIRSLARSFTDAITISEAWQSGRRYFQTVLDLVSIADNVAKGAIRVLVDGYSFSEATARNIHHSIVEACVPIEIFAKMLSRSVSDRMRSALTDVFEWINHYIPPSRAMPIISVIPLALAKLVAGLIAPAKISTAVTVLSPVDEVATMLMPPISAAISKLAVIEAAPTFMDPVD